MAADFTAAYKKVMTAEGGYGNNGRDYGGETYKGVSRNNWPMWEGWAIIDRSKGSPKFPATLDGDVSLQGAVAAFYKKNFWNINRLGEFDNQPLAAELFDIGVNMGTGMAAKFLQRSLNVLNRGGKDYKNIVADGAIGRETIALTNAYKSPIELFNVLNTLQGYRYISICEADPSQEVFLHGWLTRCYDDK